ncbi:RNA-guided endonuclease InsQ/TnpB family protein [Aneurinibacillus migulanus]|uniref:RNA-guided endonuclease InsQ/TnpB family protein n=1 Tax=Aneurinibacillus migulanus TaxID=47500 RepID=UPI000698B51D|nr:RNA-guided endonuclease TnpB family protein [Aneurinibacillus migulanus]MCP1354694.1 transposase [Aneurinibacillus migulanus]
MKPKVKRITHLVKLKNPTKRKQTEWREAQRAYADCINACIPRLIAGETLSSANVEANLKSAIRNEAIRRAKKAVSDYQSGSAKKVPVFKSRLPININNQNWDTKQKNGRWYIGFVVSSKKKYIPVEENDFVKHYFSFFEPNIVKQTKQVKNRRTGEWTEKHVRSDINRAFRCTIQLLRKGESWYLAIPVEVACPLSTLSILPRTSIGIDLGLRHLAVVSEPVSGKRQFFSGKEVGYIRRHYRSLRRSLGKKKALRAIMRLGHKESRWMKDYNRKLARQIVDFALQFDRPVIKMENLGNIRETCHTTNRADRILHSWSFYQLQQCIVEQAEKYHIRVLFVDPHYTSQMCHVCKHIDKKNRHRDRFHCQKCGHNNHADQNAARNIALCTSLAV